MCQWVLTRKRTLWGGGALERCHGAFLESVAQLGDALCSVGATAATIEAAELVEGQAAKGRRCQWALTRKQTHSGRWGALEFGHGAALERLAQLGYALGGVGTDARIIDAAELIVAQAATGRSVNGR